MPRPTGCVRCGAKLARDNADGLCGGCRRKVIDAPDSPDFWTYPPMRDALTGRMMGTVIGVWRAHPFHGRVIPQRELAALADISQPQIRRYERGVTKIATLDALDKWAELLRIPISLRWWVHLGLLPSTGDTSHDQSARRDVLSMSKDDGREPVDRRSLLKVAGVTAASTAFEAPWDRLGYALANPSRVDASTVAFLETRTAELYRREEVTPPTELYDALLQHGAMLRQFIDAGPAPSLAGRLITAAGETEALTGWLEFDIGRHGRAQKRYWDALTTARQVGDRPLQACVLTYMSYMASAENDADEARRLLQDAQSMVMGTTSPATRAWLAAREAESSAELNDREGAVRALERAYTTFDYIRPQAERVWTEFFRPSRLGSIAVSTYVRLKHPSRTATAKSVIASLSPSENGVKAAVLADLAGSAAYDKDYALASEYAEDAANVALENPGSWLAGQARSRLQQLSGALPADPMNGHLKTLRDQLLSLP